MVVVVWLLGGAPMGELNLVASLGERTIMNADIPTVLRICASNHCFCPEISQTVTRRKRQLFS